MTHEASLFSTTSSPSSTTHPLSDVASNLRHSSIIASSITGASSSGYGAVSLGSGSSARTSMAASGTKAHDSTSTTSSSIASPEKPSFSSNTQKLSSPLLSHLLPRNPASHLPKACLLYFIIALGILSIIILMYLTIHIWNPHFFFVSLFSYYQNLTPRYLAYPMLEVRKNNEYFMRWRVHLPKQLLMGPSSNSPQSNPLKLHFYYNNREIKIRNFDARDPTWYEVRFKNQELHGNYAIRAEIRNWWLDWYYWWVFHYNGRIETSRIDRVNLRTTQVKETSPPTTNPVSPSTPSANPEGPTQDTTTTPHQDGAGTPTQPTVASSDDHTPQSTSPQEQEKTQLAQSSIFGSSSLGSNLPTTKPAFEMIWISDNQMGHSAFRDLIRQIEYRHMPHADLMIHGGDRVQRGTTEHEWYTHYHDILQPLLRQRSIPFINIVGNHDFGPTLYKWTSEEKYYQKEFLRGQVQLIVLDSMYDSLAQREWVERVLSTSRAQFKIVCTHIPPFIEYWDPVAWNQKNEKSWNAIMQSYYAPLFEKHSVHLVLSGHQHNYQRGKRNKTHYVVSGGGGGEIDYERVEDFGIYEQTRFEHHYMVLKAYNGRGQRITDGRRTKVDELVLEARNRNGVVIDSFQIRA